MVPNKAPTKVFVYGIHHCHLQLITSLYITGRNGPGNNWKKQESIKVEQHLNPSSSYMHDKQ